MKWDRVEEIFIESAELIGADTQSESEGSGAGVGVC